MENFKIYNLGSYFPQLVVTKGQKTIKNSHLLHIDYVLVK